jgi:hypothetical protein
MHFQGARSGGQIALMLRQHLMDMLPLKPINR